ncbi:MAG: NAD(+) diphosphatase [Novosphingobium sp.]|nr:NAD(+) diphosphatase [Novosphingobium sp.]
MNTPTMGFAGTPIDRADHIRSDPAQLESLKDWRARLLRLDGLDPVLDVEGALQWGTLADCAPDAELVFLGLRDGHGCFAAVPEQGEAGPLQMGSRARAAMGILGPDDLAAYGMARSLVDWHARHRFCAVCGQPTQPAKAGWQRDCGACGGQHFPRVDPVTIMLVEHDGRLLLGRQPRFPKGFYSALAGFVEPGESIEEAVTREVLEEAGVKARKVSYVASQPWPFPSQLMIGCHAETDDPALTIDRTELEDARWFSREEVAEAMARREGAAFTPPPPQAIAHSLLHWWLGQ